MNKTWWGEEFLGALKSFIEERRLSRGSAYRNQRRLSSYKQIQNVVSATIMGNINPYFGVYETPYYKTKIVFTKILNPEYLISEMNHDPLLLAKLITRELPSSISFILPQSKKDIKSSCSCPDWENPCKHVAGLYLKIAETIDHNPLLLFDLRGINEDLISDKIKKHIHITDNPTSNIVAPIKPPLATNEVNIKSFWGNSHQNIRTSLSVKIPSVLVRKAGINPPFWYKRKPFLDCMNNIYKNINSTWSRMLK